MDRIDRLLDKAAERVKVLELYRDNPYMGKTFDELISIMPPVMVPDAALLEACRNRQKLYDIFCQVGGGGLKERASEPVGVPEKTAAEPKKEVDPMEVFNSLYGGGGGA